MGIDESEAARLMRGQVPSDDPVWGEVSSFLDNIGTAYPAVPTTAVEGRHLAAVARESRLVHEELRHVRQGAVKRLFHGTHRLLAGSVAGVLIAVTAGVGVASALGINPLEQLFSPRPTSSPAVPQATSTGDASSDPADGEKNGEPGATAPRDVPGSVPTPTALPTPGPTSTRTPGSVGDEHKNPRATEKANNANTPTPRKATPDPPRAKPTPTKATPPGQGKKGG